MNSPFPFVVPTTRSYTATEMKLVGGRAYR
jgi:hypothetical protein